MVKDYTQQLEAFLDKTLVVGLILVAMVVFASKAQAAKPLDVVCTVKTEGESAGKKEKSVIERNDYRIQTQNGKLYINGRPSSAYQVEPTRTETVITDSSISVVNTGSKTDERGNLITSHDDIRIDRVNRTIHRSSFSTINGNVVLRIKTVGTCKSASSGGI